MVWHIFKKDWRLLWPFFAVVAAIQFIPAMIRLKLGLFGEDPVLEYALLPATVVAFFAVAFLAVAIIHQDSVPEACQDWLVRPVKRRELLLAKLLFVLVLVQGSVVVADIFQALASGFAVGQSLVAAIAHNVFLVFIFTLPALALATVTSTMTEAIVGGIVAFFGGAAVLTLFVLANNGEERISSTGTGSSWVALYGEFMLILLGACIVLGTQYFRRGTIAARWSVAISVVLFVVVLQLLPWKTVFAVQQRLSPSPGAARSVSLLFDASHGKYQRPSGVTMSDEEMWKHLRRQGSPSQVFLPLHVSGLPDDSVLKADKSELRLIASDGKVVYRGNGEDLEVRQEGLGDGQASVHHEVDVPETVYQRLKSQSLRLEIDYSLTLFRLGSAFGIAALGGDQRAPKLGWCATQMSESGSAIELRCMQAGNGPSCATAFLESVSTGLRNPSLSACGPDYSPRFERTDTDPMSRFGVNLPFHDPSGLTHYPVDGPQLFKSQVVLRLYEPQDHFTRKLVIPSITLKDWESK